MSADGFGIIGMAALAIVATPVLIGGAVVAGGVYATGKLINYIAEEEKSNRIARQKREAEKRARLAAEEAADRKRIQEVMSSYSQLQEAQFSVRQAMKQQLVDSYQLFANELHDSQERTDRGTNILIQHAEENRKKLISSWVEQSNSQADLYSDKVQNFLGKMRNKVQQEIDEFHRFASKISEDSRLSEFAASQLDSARIMIKTLRVELDYVPDSLISGYNRAADYYNKGMYENAYGAAASVTMECYDVLEKGLVERERVQMIADTIKMQVVELRSRLEAVREFEFDYNGERFEDDLLRFSPFSRGILLQLNEIENQVADTEKCDIRLLTRLQSRLADIGYDINECIKLAAQKLLFAYTENDKASDITQAMEEQGYDVVGYAYESDQEGQPIHINFENRVTHGQVTVVLSPSTKNNEIHVDVHDYGVDGMADTRRQDELRHLIERTLDIRISCRNRGHVSSDAKASDLQKVKSIHLQ